MSNTTKVARLTASNITALAQAQEETGLELVTIGATVAVFPGDPAEALAAMTKATDQLGAKYGRRGHPVASCHAVIRKLAVQV